MSSVLPSAYLVLIGPLLVCGQPASAQEFKLTANAELVLLDVSVKEAKGGFVSNLKKENFQIYENGKLQTISQSRD